MNWSWKWQNDNDKLTFFWNVIECENHPKTMQPVSRQPGLICWTLNSNFANTAQISQARLASSQTLPRKCYTILTSYLCARLAISMLLHTHESVSVVFYECYFITNWLTNKYIKGCNLPLLKRLFFSYFCMKYEVNNYKRKRHKC